MTPKEIMENKIPKKLADHPEKVKSIGAVIQFEISGDAGGSWVMNCQNGGTVVAGKDDSAKVTISMTDADFVKMIEGELSGQMAFLTGKLKVKGDMGTALKLGSILS